MDWLNDIPSATGIDLVVALMAKKFMDGPVTFRSPFWDGEIKIEALDDYRAWIRTVERIGIELDAEKRALEIWEMEKNGIFAGVRIP